MAFDRVSAPALAEAELVEDAFMPVARHGASAVEVGIALQRALASVGRLGGALPGSAAALSRYWSFCCSGCCAAAGSRRCWPG